MYGGTKAWEQAEGYVEQRRSSRRWPDWGNFITYHGDRHDSTQIEIYLYERTRFELLADMCFWYLFEFPREQCRDRQGDK